MKILTSLTSASPLHSVALSHTNKQHLQTRSPGFPNDSTSKSHRVHEESAREKICVPYAKAFLIHGVTVLPFTVDHLGGLGSFATSFLFGSSATATIQPAEKAPPWTIQDFCSNKVAFPLYQQIDDIVPKALFPRQTRHGAPLPTPRVTDPPTTPSFPRNGPCKRWHSTRPLAWQTTSLQPQVPTSPVNFASAKPTKKHKGGPHLIHPLLSSFCVQGRLSSTAKHTLRPILTFFPLDS